MEEEEEESSTPMLRGSSIGERDLLSTCPSTCSKSGSYYCTSRGCAFCGRCRRRERKLESRDLQGFACTPRIHLSTVAQANQGLYYETLTGLDMCQHKNNTVIRLDGVASCQSQISSVYFQLNGGVRPIKIRTDTGAPYTVFGDGPASNQWESRWLPGGSSYSLNVTILGHSQQRLWSTFIPFRIAQVGCDAGAAADDDADLMASAVDEDFGDFLKKNVTASQIERRLDKHANRMYCPTGTCKISNKILQLLSTGEVFPLTGWPV